MFLTVGSYTLAGASFPVLQVKHSNAFCKGIYENLASLQLLGGSLHVNRV